MCQRGRGQATAGRVRWTLSSSSVKVLLLRCPFHSSARGLSPSRITSRHTGLPPLASVAVSTGPQQPPTTRSTSSTTMTPLALILFNPAESLRAPLRQGSPHLYRWPSGPPSPARHGHEAARARGGTSTTGTTPLRAVPCRHCGPRCGHSTSTAPNFRVVPARGTMTGTMGHFCRAGPQHDDRRQRGGKGRRRRRSTASEAATPEVEGRGRRAGRRVARSAAPTAGPPRHGAPPPPRLEVPHWPLSTRCFEREEGWRRRRGRRRKRRWWPAEEVAAGGGAGPGGGAAGVLPAPGSVRTAGCGCLRCGWNHGMGGG
jgi:hypothetical protein